MDQDWAMEMREWAAEWACPEGCLVAGLAPTPNDVVHVQGRTVAPRFAGKRGNPGQSIR